MEDSPEDASPPTSVEVTSSSPSASPSGGNDGSGSPAAMAGGPLLGPGAEEHQSTAHADAQAHADATGGVPAEEGAEGERVHIITTTAAAVAHGGDQAPPKAAAATPEDHGHPDAADAADAAHALAGAADGGGAAAAEGVALDMDGVRVPMPAPPPGAGAGGTVDAAAAHGGKGRSIAESSSGLGGSTSAGACVRFEQWLRSWALPGLGMLSESYVLFAVGNIQSIFAAEWAKGAIPAALLQSITYTQVAGIIVGMLVTSVISDHIGRRKAAIANAILMLAGVLMLTFTHSSDLTTQFEVYTAGLFVFGLGVGGEYPVAASAAAEESEAAVAATGKPPQRGQAVMMVFSMQGMGTFLNALVIVILMLIFEQTTQSLDPAALDWVWRIQYGIGAFALLLIVAYRLKYARDPALWSQQHRSEANKNVSTLAMLRHLCVFYWPRMIGTGLVWLVWDVCYYGNRLFQGSFIAVIEGESSTIFSVMLWTLLNAGIALVGYYVAAGTSDKTWMGRLRMQNMGFVIISVCFLVCGIWIEQLRTDEYIHLFQVLYYITSFFGQFGPNATTWLLPSEVFPTEFRATAHGISAALGKVGALIAGICFQYASPQWRFLWCGICSVIGLLFSIVFVADVTTLDLHEADAYWFALRDGRAHTYAGPANRPKHLSIFENMTNFFTRASDWVAARAPRPSVELQQLSNAIPSPQPAVDVPAVDVQ